MKKQELYPKYLKLKTKESKYYVKLIDDSNNLHLRKTWNGFAMDYNYSPNEYYESDDFIGCSREEFECEFEQAVEILNKATKI